MDVAELAVHRKNIVETFSRYDANGDGSISREEMCALLKELDDSGCLGYDGVDNMLAALDRNGDGIVDIEEFVDWVLSTDEGTAFQCAEDLLDQLTASHVFMTPEDEASMERLTLLELQKEENSKILADMGWGPLDDPKLLVMSVGSSSSQAYDAQDLVVSFPVGTKVSSAEVYKDIISTLRQRSVKYDRVLLVNSIGYMLSDSDPQTVPLSELIARPKAKQSVVDLHATLVEALPDAKLHVYNRAKDPTTKRYKYAQLSNDFSLALVSGRGMQLCSHANTLAKQDQDAVVDWGGGSFKVYADGKRIASEIMDANAFICGGGVLQRERLSEAIRMIKLFVLRFLPHAKYIFIAQTGKTRELAIREGLFCGQ